VKANDNWTMLSCKLERRSLGQFPFKLSYVTSDHTYIIETMIELGSRIQFQIQRQEDMAEHFYFSFLQIFCNSSAKKA
jgi:hypothetical protein